MSLQSFFDNLTLLADAPNGVANLRELILQLAVAGKLDTQNQNDEPAYELFERIKLKGKRLRSDRRTNQADALAPITNKVGYALPLNWELVRLGEVQLFTNGYAFKSGDYQPDGVGIVRIGDISDGEISKSAMRFVSPAFLKSLDPKFQVKNGDLLIAMSGATTGKLGFNRTNDVFLLNQRVGKIDFIEVLPKYGFFFLGTKISENLNSSAGSAIPNLSTEQINNIPFPLPPLEEQKRIIAKVNELMRLCDELESRQQASRESRVCLNNVTLAPLNNAASLAPEGFEQATARLADNFAALCDSPETVSELRSTILQLAVQGKLAAQDPHDEPASALLERTQRIRARSKGNRQPERFEVQGESLPFDVPSGWNWCRLVDLGVTQTGTTPATSRAEYYGNDYPFVKPADIRGESVSYRTAGLSKLGLEVGRLVPAQSVLMVSIGGSIGKVGIVDRECSCNQQINYITLHEGISSKLIYYFLKSPYFQAQVLSRAPQTTLPILSKGKWEVIPLPLPPLAEQKRIVAKVNQLMTLCDELEAKLRQAEADSAKLMNAAVQHVLESVRKSWPEHTQTVVA